MTMDPIFPQPGDIAPLSLPALLPASAAPAALIPEISRLDRISRLAALGPEDTVAGLLWLAMNFPAVCDAMLDKAECGADIGIFLRYGTDWRHYLGDFTTTGQIEAFDPGHDPVVAWRLPGIPA
jgi:hypothetical protein